MPEYSPRPILVLLWLLATTAGAQTLAPANDGAAALRPTGEESEAGAGYVDPMDEWLEEVKAQRRAWEERRRAAKEAINARRRLTDPWGAAQQEARDKELQRRHDAMIEQFERDHEAFRNQVPWPSSPSRWDQGAAPAAGQSAPTADAPAPIQEHIDAPPPPAPERAPQNTANSSTYPPSGWDNRWYYRGY
jgi:hypothetical protein